MLALALAGAIGCRDVSVPGSALDTAPDPPMPDAAARGDGAADGTARFAPIHLRAEDLISGAPDLMVNEPTQIDTSELTINGQTSPYLVRQGTYAVLFTAVFTVASPVRIDGESPLIVVASDRVTLRARVDVSGHGSLPGPGGRRSGPGVGGAGAFAPVELGVSSGGGGGSHGTAGAPGGDGTHYVRVPPGEAGELYGAQIGDPLVGGSSGGGGGGDLGSVGSGGGGGGAIQISSAVSIHVAGSGAINAGGGGGPGGWGGKIAGGGGGAGGEIVLEARSLAIEGILAANGGGGGAGGCGGGNCLAGMGGWNGSDLPWPTPAGRQGEPQGSAGGEGAAGVVDYFVQSQPGDSGVQSGGGGGGAGRIWLRYRGSTPPDLRRVWISPPAGLDPTL